MKSWIRKPLISIYIFITGVAVEAAVVSDVSCGNAYSSILTTKATLPTSEKDCYIDISGVIDERDVLIIPYVADADVLSFEGQEIGRTGFFFGYKFHAAFFPRVYSLKLLKDINSPRLKLHAWSFLNTELGIKSSKEEILILDQNRAMKTYLKLLSKPLGILITILMVFILSLNFVNKKNSEGWSWSKKSKRAYQLSSTLFMLSMTRVLRVFIPSLLSIQQYYLFHATVEAIAIWALTEMILETRFVDQSSYRDDSRNLKSDTKFFRIFNLLVLTACLFSFLILFQYYEIQFVHSIAVLAQAILIASAALYQIAKLNFKKVFLRSMMGSSFFVITELATAFVILRDSIVFIFFHKPGVHYYSPDAMLLVLFAGFIRSSIIQKCEQKAMLLSNEIRKLLRNIPHGQDQLEVLSNEIHKNWPCDRVSILSIINNEVIVLSSSGPFPLNQKTEPKPVGPILKILMNKKQPLYIASVDDLDEIHREQGFNRSCFLIPLLQDSKIIGAISITGSEKSRLSPYQSHQLIVSTTFIESEVIGALNNALLEKSQKEINEYTVGMSGMVFEHMNAWGHIQKNNPASRRVIVSADGLKSTYLEQVVSTSPILYELAKEYKSELYAGWIAIKQVFEMVSADVHGDDFLIVTPLKFKNPELEKLGPETVALACANLIEQYARDVASKSYYRPLGRAGAHVAVGAGMLELIGLGISNSICPNIEGPVIYKLNRIRGEADPGAVLVDTEDPKLNQVLNESSHFISKKYLSPLGEVSFSELKNQSKITMLVGIQNFPFMSIAKPQIQEMIQNSPYLR